VRGVSTTGRAIGPDVAAAAPALGADGGLSLYRLSG
jgi:hypothetical protein